MVKIIRDNEFFRVVRIEGDWRIWSDNLYADHESAERLATFWAYYYNLELAP